MSIDRKLLRRKARAELPAVLWGPSVEWATRLGFSCGERAEHKQNGTGRVARGTLGAVGRMGDTRVFFVAGAS
jgi:hypothetical protein